MKKWLGTKLFLIFFVMLSFISYLPASVHASDDLDVSLPLEGRITDENGNPLKGITLSVISPIILGSGGGYRDLGSATTDENGHYHMDPFLRLFYDQGIGTFIKFNIKGYPVIRSLGQLTTFDFRFPSALEHVEGTMSIEGTNLPNPGLPVSVGIRMTKRDLYVLSSSITDEKGHYSMEFIPASFTTFDDRGSVIVSELTKYDRFYDSSGTSPVAPGTIYGYLQTTYGSQIGNASIEIDGITYTSSVGGFAINPGDNKSHHFKVSADGFVTYEADLLPGGPYYINLEYQPLHVVATADRSPDQNGWYNHDVTISFGAEPFTYVHIDPPQVITTEGADQVITGFATDIFGNEVSGSITLNLDKTAPATTASLSDSTDIWLKSVVLTLMPTDGVSGVLKTEYSLDNGKTWSIYNGPTSFTTDGRYSILYRSSDKAGNIEAPKTITFKLDGTAPTIKVVEPKEKRYQDARDLALSFTAEEMLSGIDWSKTIATLDGQLIQSGVSIPLYTLPLGIHSIKIKTADFAGNGSNLELKFETYTDLDSLSSLVKRFAAEGKIKTTVADTLQNKLDKNQLKTFINLVEAHKGKAIDATTAEYLLRDAQVLN